MLGVIHDQDFSERLSLFVVAVVEHEERVGFVPKYGRAAGRKEVADLQPFGVVTVCRSGDFHIRRDNSKAAPRRGMLLRASCYNAVRF
jgi:hypothetical protein